MKAWKDLRLVVPGKANSTGQFLIHSFSQGMAFSLTHFFHRGHVSCGKSPENFPYYEATPHARAIDVELARGIMVVYVCVRVWSHADLQTN